MKVFVTGGAGYIGTHMVLALVDAGHAAVVYDDLSTGFEMSIPPGVPFERGTVLDRDCMWRLMREHGCDSVVHFAAKTVVPESIDNPYEYYLTNALGTNAVASAAVKAGIRNFVLSSTAAVYGEVSNEPVTEDAPLSPASPYGASKAMAERMLWDNSYGSDLSAVALRYFNVAGADPLGRAGQSTRNATHLFKVISEVACGRRDVFEVFGTDYATKDGTCVRDFIHVSDLCDAHILALERCNDTPGLARVFNCGYGRGYSVLDVVGAFAKVTGRPIDLVLQARRNGDAQSVVACPDRLKKELGWRPKFDDINQIAADALRWERSARTLM